MAAILSTATSVEGSRAQSPIQHGLRHPFNFSSRNTPGTSTPTSYHASAFHLPAVGSQKYFKSRRINPEDIQKPWLGQKDPKKKSDNDKIERQRTLNADALKDLLSRANTFVRAEGEPRLILLTGDFDVDPCWPAGLPEQKGEDSAAVAKSGSKK